MIEYAKVKSVAKQIEYKGERLDGIILDTVNKVSSIVGSTLGPGGNPVLIERLEHDLPPTVTKDGVTVFRAIGLDSSVAHCIMESMRDSALKTASDAGDGTTTATILAASIITNIKKYCKDNPKVSPQRIMRRLDQVFAEIIEPEIKKLSIKIQLNDEGKKLLKGVAQLSANGDEELADAVIRCFEITGDDGNVTIIEQRGKSGVKEEQIEGYPIGIGYEKSCLEFWPQFVNDSANQRSILENPVFLLYYGKITEPQAIHGILNAVGHSADPVNTPTGIEPFSHNVVIMATGFSDVVIAELAANFPMSNTINVIPLLVPETIQQGSQHEFLKDVAAITGAKIFEPLTKPLNTAKLEDLGSGLESFEFGRYRSSIIGIHDEDLQLVRVDEVRTQLEKSISEIDRTINQERLAKLVGGIAKLQIYGSSNGETKERRDRAEDAVCAVRGAIKYGCLPGGGWTLLRIVSQLTGLDEIVDSILRPALKEPFNRLISNCGIIDESEIASIIIGISKGYHVNEPIVYDFLNQKHCNALTIGLLDSTPAVLEAVRNSLSIAGRIGTLGGVLVQRRDKELEQKESMANSSFLRQIDENPANERF